MENIEWFSPWQPLIDKVKKRLDVGDGSIYQEGQIDSM